MTTSLLTNDTHTLICKHLPDLLEEEFSLPMGTGPYMSPEQVQFVRNDPRSDLFALGVMLYHFTTGGPRVMLGTKCPSITSTWMTVPPPRSAAATCSARWAKSADRIDGKSSTIGLLAQWIFGVTPCPVSVSAGTHKSLPRAPFITASS